MKHPHVLVILDGFGYRHAHEHNAIYQAHPEHFLTWLTQYPHATLHASGSSVGLLPHMIGNSEVGHLTIGGGRVIKQPVSVFHDMIADGTFFSQEVLTKRLKELAHTKKRLHIMGLLSDGGVHSHIEELLALLKMAGQQGITSVFVHPFLDGRDVPPQSAALYLEEVEKALRGLKNGKWGSIHGRFYAMDRDHHWERTERSYKVLTTPQRPQFATWQQALADSYEKQITDEFFVPVAMDAHGYIQPGDALIFGNFRADRARQLTKALIDPRFDAFHTRPTHLSWMLTLTSYLPDLEVEVLLQKPVVQNTFFDVLERAQQPIFTIAETEKYAHVTYFFNGGREIIHQHETRILIPSKRHYATYAHNPEMSAPEITQAVLQALQENSNMFYLINYANADMVGHSGDYLATVKAIQVLDAELKKLYTRVVEQLGGTLYITADHGKAEEMWDIQRNQPRTAHTLNKVPFLYITKSAYGNTSPLKLKELSDIAPFILHNLGLPIPDEMRQDFTD